jgi:hypothetical protein
LAESAHSDRYKRALELALEIERLLEPAAPESKPTDSTRQAGSSRETQGGRAYAGRIAQAMVRSLIDQLKEIVRTSAA